MIRIILLIAITIGVFVEAGIWTALAIFLIAIVLDTLICEVINNGY